MPKRNFEQGIGLLLLRLKNPVTIPQKHALMVFRSRQNPSCHRPSFWGLSFIVNDDATPDEASRDVDFR